MQNSDTVGRQRAVTAAERPCEYSVRQVADMVDCEPSTLRYYEECGLLTDVGRTTSGQRVYTQKHLDRLGAIACFKHAGMTIADLRRFFAYEDDESEHIDDMVDLLRERCAAIEEQTRVLHEAHLQVLRKLHFYGDIRSSIRRGTPSPRWDDYSDKDFVD